MNEEKVLKALKDKLEAIKTEYAQKEGAMASTLELIKKEFGIQTIEEAEDKLKELESQIEEKKKQRTKYLEQAQKKLEAYQ
ncbi:MAG: hypothetical protein WC302_00785 [Candidatus Paceibacterota bacterium]|jgi:septin family protein